MIILELAKVCRLDWHRLDIQTLGKHCTQNSLFRIFLCQFKVCIRKVYFYCGLITVQLVTCGILLLQDLPAFLLGSITPTPAPARNVYRISAVYEVFSLLYGTKSTTLLLASCNEVRMMLIMKKIVEGTTTSILGVHELFLWSATDFNGLIDFNGFIIAMPKHVGNDLTDLGLG